jgi:hypothetical protein
MRQILFPLIVPVAFSEQAALMPDTLERVVADGEIKFADQTTDTASGQRFAELDQLRFPLGWSCED